MPKYTYVNHLKFELKITFKHPIIISQIQAQDEGNPYSAGIDFICQNLTSVDVRFWRLKSIPAMWE